MNGNTIWNRILGSFFRPLLLIAFFPLCLLELFSTISKPAIFWICLGESKRPISPTSALKPVAVTTPTLLQQVVFLYAEPASAVSTYSVLPFPAEHSLLGNPPKSSEVLPSCHFLRVCRYCCEQPQPESVPYSYQLLLAYTDTSSERSSPPNAIMSPGSDASSSTRIPLSESNFLYAFFVF